MKKTSNTAAESFGSDSFSFATTIAALLFLAAKFPHRQFNGAELSVLSGIGRTAISQIKNAQDTPFSLGKCTLRCLDGWLAKHPGFKQQ
ncbi:MAG: hypothetical protein H0X34_20060 [Chthoniobacterales bacterium]|jgi:hypothetical protein|nr:hypothetical protein [Chthoniobacterales bacterium]